MSNKELFLAGNPFKYRDEPVSRNIFYHYDLPISKINCISVGNDYFSNVGRITPKGVHVFNYTFFGFHTKRFLAFDEMKFKEGATND